MQIAFTQGPAIFSTPRWTKLKQTNQTCLKALFKSCGYQQRQRAHQITLPRPRSGESCNQSVGLSLTTAENKDARTPINMFCTCIVAVADRVPLMSLEGQTVQAYRVRERKARPTRQPSGMRCCRFPSDLPHLPASCCAEGS